MVKPRISVVVPVYNLESYVKETLQSLQSQTYTDFQAIIVDDGSTDASANIIKPFLNDRRFSYIHQSNTGAASARNRALAAAVGEWFALLDGDDVWMPEKLELQMRIADQDQQVSIIYGRSVVFDDIGNDYGRYWSKELPEGDIKAALFEENFIVASSVVVRTQALRDIGGFTDQRLVEDYDAWLRLVQQGAWTRVCKKDVVKYRIRPGSQVSAQILNLQLLEETLERALEREHDRRCAGILKRRIAHTRSNKAYELARKAARESSPDVERYLWECWRYRPAHVKRLALATICSVSRVGGIGVGRKVVANRLSRNASPWETDTAVRL